ncbi:MAG: hypothetical protein OXM61_25245 [Candidatus Poribacteria bacterium]|nr:hypothetical protein [Candidatus Poribacteria bacterium]
MNTKKEIFQLVADTASVATGHAYIGLTSRALSLLLDLTRNEEEALYKFLEHMNDIIHEKTKKGDDSLRSDWHHENIGTDVSARMMKKTFETLKNEIEEKKERYIAYFCGNIHLTSNSHVSIHTAIEILNKIEPLTYRQLCVIKYINESPKTRVLKNLQEDGFSDYLSKMPEDQKSDYFSTCREIEALNDDGYTYGGVRPSTYSGTQPSTSYGEGANPVIERLPIQIGAPTDLAKEIYTLAALSKIPGEHMRATFQYWE